MRDEHCQRPNLRKEPHLLVKPVSPSPQLDVIQSRRRADSTIETRLVDIVDDTINHLALKRLEHNRAVSRDELGLPAPRQHNTTSNVENGDDGDDVAKLSRTGAFDVRIELRL